jgi:hypothetical protein
MRRPGRLIFLLALSPRRRLEDALKTLLADRQRDSSMGAAHIFSAHTR